MTAPGMNRQQRRAAVKRTCHAPPRTATADAGLRLLHNARPYDDGEMVAEHAVIRAESIAPSIVTTMQAGQAALCRMKDRYLRAGVGLQTVHPANRKTPHKSTCSRRIYCLSSYQNNSKSKKVKT